MEKLRIRGGAALRGTVSISGAKNAAVAILPAVLLSDGVCRIENLPNISDVSSIIQVLHTLGAEVRMLSDSAVEIDPRPVRSCVVSKEAAKTMRASSYFIGALLGRCGRSRVAPPGGCDFGVASHLRGASVYLDVVSVGATINIMLAAARVRGMTVIENAAREPHIVDLANFLNSMGADIMGAGTSVIKIRGVEHLQGATYSIIPDQIEAGTYMAAAAATRGDVLVTGVIPKHLESILAKLIEMGVDVEEYDEAVRVSMRRRPRKCNIKTMPHPGFPTDMQPQIATLLAVADGTSIITEGVWDNRFRYVDQLVLMGADIQVDGKTAVISGVDRLTCAPVRATDLRAGAAMVIAGLSAEGVTEIEDIDHIDRGYENIVEKLTALGADIRRVRVDAPDRQSQVV